ncbi:MAG: TSUP family transporter [Hyphomicrobiales bacterium]|nr:TSUP family transporter [Hyphomicrobiales bacterium]
MGLPITSLALLTALLDFERAVTLMLVPSLVTNVWQGAVGGHFRALVARLWSFLLLGGVLTTAVAAAAGGLDARLLAGGLGVLLCAYSAVSLATPQVPTPGRHETWLSPLMGALTGALTGLTGSFVFPAVLYLQALRLPRDMFIQAMGVFFTVCTACLALALGNRGLVSGELALLSAGGVIPALAGMVLGRRIRRRLSERRFRQVLFATLIVVGAFIVVRNLVL